MKDYYQERKEMIEKAAKDAAKIDGYRVLKSPERNYFFIITPADNVLYIQLDEFFGMCASFQYRPNAKTGSGCGCGCGKGNERYKFYEINKDLLEYLEKDGIFYAHKLKATFYKNSQEWLERFWEAAKLEEIKPE